MTREFNKQRRDDTRPSFRDRSSNNYRDERSSPPGRARLNRETVDRAWKSGAQHTHADYRSRNNNGQFPRNNWRNNHNQQPSEYSSSQNGHGGNRPYNNRQEHYRDNAHNSERSSDDFHGSRNPRARSFGPNNTGRQQYGNSRPGGRQQYDNSRSGDRRHNGERPNASGARQDYRRTSGQPGGRDDRFGHRERGGYNQRPDFERNERPFSHERRGAARQYSSHSGPDTRNARWQSRSWVRREASPEEWQEHSSRSSHEEQFEGDYERFNNNESFSERHDAPHRSSRPERGRPRREYAEEGPAQESHVTRLPDGRVIKGPRPTQRQEARFWTEVANDTEGLIGHIQVEDEEVDEAPKSEAASDAAGKPSKKTRARSASATVRGRKAGAAKEKKSGPRPSQRGFKWPTP